MKSKSWTSETIAAPRDHQGQCEEAECGQCTDSNPASIGADLQNVLNIDAGLRTMNHFSSVGASQPVLSGKKPDKQRPDLRSLCHEEATGRGGEPSNPIATHFLLYFCSSYSTLIYFPLVHAWFFFYSVCTQAARRICKFAQLGFSGRGFGWFEKILQNFAPNPNRWLGTHLSDFLCSHQSTANNQQQTITINNYNQRGKSEAVKKQ